VDAKTGEAEWAGREIYAKCFQYSPNVEEMRAIDKDQTTNLR
jgi:hypothetical protein